jgi:hypothetical protein
LKVTHADLLVLFFIFVLSNGLTCGRYAEGVLADVAALDQLVEEHDVVYLLTVGSQAL